METNKKLHDIHQWMINKSILLIWKTKFPIESLKS